MQNKFLIICLLLFSIGRADTEKNIWKLKVIVDNSNDVLKVYEVIKKSKTPILNFSSKNGSSFKAGEEVFLSKFNKKVLVTRWTFGAHSEIFRIFDPSNQSKPIQFELRSTWPVDFEVKDDRLVISVPEEKYVGDPNPGAVTTEWAPDFDTKASRPNTSPAPQNP